MARGNDNRLRDSYQIIRRGHGDLPEEEWPGRSITRDDVVLASQHKLDVLSESDRLRAFDTIEASFYRNYETRSVTPHWRFTLLLGKMGSGKSTLASILFAVKRAQGWPVFHTGSLLFGRVLAANEIFTAVNRMPDNSCLFIDETHVVMGLAADNARHSTLFLQSMAGLRKKNCELILATAADDLMSRKLKREAHEVIVPFSPDVAPLKDNSIRSVRRRRLGLPPIGGAPRDSKLFRLGFTTIEGYPFAQDGLLELYGLAPEAGDPKAHELRQRLIHPRLVKEGLLLNDSFQQVPVGIQMTVNRQSVVDNQGDYLFGGAEPEPEDPATAGLEDWQRALWDLLHYVATLTYKPKERLTATDMVDLIQTDIEPGAFGSRIKQVLRIRPNTRGGYLISELAEGLRQVFRTEEG